MSARKRDLDSFFDAARSEQSPISAETSRALISGAEPARSPYMLPSIIVGSALALATAAGITVKIIHDDTDKKANNRVAEQPSVIPNGMRNEQPSVIPNGMRNEQPTVIPNSREERVAEQHILNTQPSPLITQPSPLTTHPSPLNTITLSAFGITALRADDDIVRSLGLEPRAVQEICRNLAGADSLTNCSINMSDAKVKVCVFKDGSTDEVVFMDKPGPMPVMFTSSDGKGHVVASHFSREVDPNKLVPVAAKGCGDNMVMWFQPTKDFVMSMPEDLGKDLERVLDVEVRIETKDGKTKVRHRQKNLDGTVTEEDIELNDVDLKEFDGNIMMLNEIKDPRFTKPLVDSIMRDVELQVPNQKRLRDLLDSAMGGIRMKLHDSVLARTMEIVTDDNIGPLSDADSFSVRKRVVIRMNADKTTLDFNACTPNVQRFEFLSSPNINSRVIILSNGHKRPVIPNVPQPIEHASLQETRTSQGAVAGSMLFPNPTTDGGATISFSLTASRTLNLSLLNLNGEKVMDLARNVYRTAGDGQLAFALNNTAPGMYLVVLETDQGERVVQRLIVQ